MEPFILLFAAFAVLGFLDVVCGGRIPITYILFFAVAFVLLFLYNAGFDVSGYAASSGTLELIGTFGSVVAIVAWPRLGAGDKIFLATTFLVYPFWLMWCIILLAMVLIKPVFRLMAHFVRDRSFALPFYPFLFLSCLIVFLVASAVFGYGALLPTMPPFLKMLSV